MARRAEAGAILAFLGHPPVRGRDMLEEGQRTPVLLRRDGKRLVLVEGLQRLEACRSLGEETIVGVLVRGRVK